MATYTDDSVVELCSVSKTFDRVSKAVDDVTLAVYPGETVAILGTSGCGKTTVLRLINRLTEPDSSTGRFRKLLGTLGPGQTAVHAANVLVRGRSVMQQDPAHLRRSIGYVIQEGGLFPHLTVEQNVATVPRLLRWSSERVNNRVGEVLALVGLPFEEFAHRKPGQLSGRQRQRVGVARALAADPDLLLMDEPFGAIDPITRETLHEEFQELQTRLKKTIILVTHDMIEAGKLADRIVLMTQGRIAQIGTIRELLFHPADEFVRAFFAPHRQQMTFETLRIDDILDDVAASKSGEGLAQVELDGQSIVRSVLDVLVRSTAESVIALNAGRHKNKLFAMDELRRRLFEDLVG